MNVNISDKVEIELKDASKTLGFEERIIVERAISFYLDTIKSRLSLKKEMDAWDSLSDEALLDFEAKL